MGVKLESVMRAVGKGNDNRIGRRVSTSELTIDWQPLVTSNRSWFGRRRWASTAEVVDLSVSGARVAVGGTHLVPVGALVRIGLAGGAGMASVRRAAHYSGGRTIYGIQFLELDPALTREVAKLVTGDRAHLDEQWTRTN